MTCSSRSSISSLPGELGLTPAAAVNLVEAAYVEALAAIPDITAKAQGTVVGRAAAAAILHLREGDGRTPPRSSTTPISQGPILETSSSSPGYDPFAAFTGWGNVTPFVLTPSSRYRPKAPYALQQQEISGGFQ